MNITRLAVSAALAGVLFTSAGFAQTPPSDTTNPSSASSPSQRDATRTPNTTETPTSSGAEPSDASSPHQRQAMAKNQSMKECMDEQAAKNTGASKTDMKKTCKDQMKSQDRTHMSKAPPNNPPSESDSSTSSSPK